MACYYTGSAEGDARLAEEEARAELGKKITHLSQLLCEACGELFKEYNSQIELADNPISPNNCSDELRQWWESHKHIDKKRKEQELAAKKQAQLDKIADKIRAGKCLTPIEVRLISK